MPQKCLILIFTEIEGYKINIQNSVVFLYTNNKLSKKKFKYFIYDNMKIIKYVEISLTNLSSKSQLNFEKKEKINPKIHMGPQKT